MDDGEGDTGRSAIKGGRPRGASETQLRRDAVFIAFQVLEELGIIPKSHQAPFARLANLIVDEESKAELATEGQRITASITPPPKLTREALKNQASYTAQHVNNTKKGAKNWNPAHLAFLQNSVELIVPMFLAPVTWAVDTLATGLVALGWPSPVVERLSDLAKLSGARRTGFISPRREDLDSLALFVRHLKESGR